VRSFYDAFNAHSFENAEIYTTEDWNHINPLGGWTRSREAVLTELKEVHSTFVKGVSVSIEDMTVRFATPDVTVVTVTDQGSTFTTSDGVRHENPRGIRTFVVVKRNGRWLIMHDQNTPITARVTVEISRSNHDSLVDRPGGIVGYSDVERSQNILT